MEAFLRLARLAGALLALLFSASAFAQTTYTWIGAVDSRWGEPGNWSPIGTPQDGDSVAFPDGVPNRSQVNDLPAGRRLATIRFNSFGGFTIIGNPLVLTAGVSNGGGNVLGMPIALGSNAQFEGGTYMSSVDVGAYALRLLNYVTFNGPVSGTGQINGSYVTSMRFTGTHPFAGVIRGSVVLVGASLPNASLAPALEIPPMTALNGYGTVGGDATVNYVSPDGDQFDRPGILQVGNLTLTSPPPQFGGSGTVWVMIAGTTPGTQHDQVVATGSVSLGAQTMVQVTLAGGFTPTVGQEFTIIDNRGGSPVIGRFAGMPPDDVVTVGPYRFQVRYNGGDGNDVTLRCIFAPNMWTGAVDNRWATPGNWSAGTPRDGDSLLFPGAAPQLLLYNDLPPTRLAGIVFATTNGPGLRYRIAGNTVSMREGGTILDADAVTFDAPVSLLTSAQVQGGTFNGPVTVTAGPVSILRTVFFNGPLSGFGEITTDYLSPAHFTGTHSFSGTVRGGMMLLGADLPAANLAAPFAYPFSLLRGNGRVGGTVNANFVTPSGDISLATPGRLEVGSLIFPSGGPGGGNIDIKIRGTSPGMGYSQVSAFSADLGNSTSLSVNLVGGYIPAANEVFTVLEIRGSAPAVGTFLGLLEGATLTIGPVKFRVSYVGGDGNDITLTSLQPPKVWSGAVDNKWSTPGNWTDGQPPVAGDAINLPAFALNPYMNNDLPAGTAFTSIVTATSSGSVVTGSYRLAGNAITLTRELRNGSAITFQVPVAIQGDVAIDGGTFDGPFEVGPHILRITGSPQFNGSVGGTGNIFVAYINNPRFTGTHSFSGVIRGSLVLLGASLPNASLLTGVDFGLGSLMGYGSIGETVITNFVAPYGPAPGSPGVLDVGHLTLRSDPVASSSMSFHIAGSPGGLGHDQVTVRGLFEIGTNATLSVSLAAAFVPTLNETYVLVSKAGTLPAIGTFLGLPEGAELTLQSVYRFRVSYRGGDGNDVTLTSLNGKNPTATTLVSSPNPSRPGDTVTLTATVTRTGGNALEPLPAGYVRFWSGGTVALVSLVNGVATLELSTMATGSHVWRAEYPGDGFNGGSTSPPLTQIVSAQGTTTPGSDVVVEVTTTLPNGQPATVDMQFSNVTSSGTTTVSASTAGPLPPTGFQLGNPPIYFDVSTTATFGGTVTLCFGWTEGQFANEAAIGLWHYEGGSWVNVTTLLDTTANTVCGRTTSLSPFTLMEARFVFSGFRSPVTALPAYNAVKAGSAVPLKFSLGGNRGLGVLAAGSPASGVIACGTGATGGEITGTATAGGSALSYDASADQYTYTWKTEKAWAGTCRALVMRFTDGTEARAQFEMR